MALDYQTHIKPLEDAGQTDDQIASYYSQMTESAIKCGDAKVMLEESQAVFEDPITGVRVGSLVDHYNETTNNDLKRLIGWFISHVFGRGEEVSTNTQPRAGQVALVVSTLPSGLQQVGLDLLALGGGQPNADLTAADVAQIRTNWQAAEDQRIADTAAAEAQARARSDHREWRDDFQTRFNTTIAPILDHQSRDNDTLIASLRAMANDLETNPWSA